MKGTLKYLLIAAAAYYFYNKYKASLHTRPQLPSGAGGAHSSGGENLQLDAVQGIKKLPHTY
jgi:hypothetical protein